VRVEIRTDAGTFPAAPPYEGADHVRSDIPCPACGASAPSSVRGAGVDVRGHDSEEAPAVALCCGATLGRIVVTYSTIFGIEEDRAVLNGRPRVY
jgi:hypothetical protein